MSAITGVVRLNGAQACPQDVSDALGALSARMRAPGRIWLDGETALAGDALLVEHDAGRSSGSAIVADARLYNRPELCAALNLSPETPDAVVILAAYRKWGEACPAYLVGDFAFAIRDHARDALFCARDHAGVRPFFYASDALQFVFASELKGILVHQPKQEVDPARIADFLVGIAPRHDATWYPDVFRLPPGHSLTVRQGRAEVHAYWRATAPASFRGGDVVEAFGSLFTEAVRCRLDDATGAMLSGGLDSSAIALTAGRLKQRPVDTFSMIFSDGADEQPQIDEVLRRGQFNPAFLETGRTGQFTDFTQSLHEQDGPVLAPGLAGCRQIYAAAARAGAGSLLDGHGGDEVVSHGLGQLKQLALAGRWLALWKESQAEAGIYQNSRARIFFTYWRHFGPARNVFRNFHRLTGTLKSRVLRSSKQSVTRPSWSRFLDPDFAVTSEIGGRWRSDLAGRNAYSTEAEQHALMLNAPMQSHALEVLDRASAHAGIEARYPFWDRRLIDFCLSLSPEDKIHDGWTRYTFRRAMKGVLPESIRQRRDKFDFSESLATSMCEYDSKLLDEIVLSERSALAGYADMGALRQAYVAMKERPTRMPGVIVQTVWRNAALACWLDNSRKSGVAVRLRQPFEIIREASCA